MITASSAREISDNRNAIPNLLQLASDAIEEACREGRTSIPYLLSYPEITPQKTALNKMLLEHGYIIENDEIKW